MNIWETWFSYSDSTVFSDCKQFLYLTQCYSIHSFLNIRQRGTIVSCYSLIQTFQNKLIFSLQNCPSNNKKTTTTKQKYNMYMFTAFAKYFAKAPFPLFTASSSFWVWCLPHHSPTMSLYFVSFIFLSCFLLLKNIPWYDSATTIRGWFWPDDAAFLVTFRHDVWHSGQTLESLFHCPRELLMVWESFMCLLLRSGFHLATLP